MRVRHPYLLLLELTGCKGDLEDADAQELGRRSIYAAAHRDAFSGASACLVDADKAKCAHRQYGQSLPRPRERLGVHRGALLSQRMACTH